ncbi:MAG: hypothetical protein GY809_27775, partial [Planctomycetes bacterium]|nr:hypothetical protein [Planctomycetota bacterium]
MPLQRTIPLGVLKLGLIMGVIIWTAMVSGAPYSGDILTLQQPDGREVKVRVWGDEFYQHVESLDGRTLAFDPKTLWITYAKLAVGSGEPRPGSEIYIGTAAADINLNALDPKSSTRRQRRKRGIRASRQQIRKHVRARRQELWNGTEPAWIASAPGGSGPDVGPVLWTRTPFAQGNHTGLVVLIDFPDRRANKTLQEVDTAFNSEQYSGNRGSIRSWTETISNQQVSVSHKIVGYYRARYPTDHYLGETYNPASWLRDEALEWLRKAGFDFSQLSTDANGNAASVLFWYAGNTIGTWGNSLWAHAGGTNFRANGVRINSYSMAPIGNDTLAMRIVRHELGHSVFKWPDTYDYDDDSRGAAGFSQETNLPNAVFRAKAGWLDVIEISHLPSGTLFELPDNGNTCLRYSRPGTSAEYFLIEYYRKSGWRSDVPDEGLLVWHVDEGGSNNHQAMQPDSHYKLSVEQADGRFDLEFDQDGESGDLFHKSYRDRFSDTTFPSALWWDRTASGLALYDIG